VWCLVALILMINYAILCMLSLRIAQRIDRAVATSISNVTAKAAHVMILALLTMVCMLGCAELTT